MKYYDIIISLGQYCITSTALRRLHLQEESSVFDWSAGILESACGKGGLSGKVDLICNNFQDFFNFEDFENRGPNQENDTYNLWIVNKKTGLQYKHDFPAADGFENKFLEVKQKYERRIKRLYDAIENSTKILFLFMARDGGFSDAYLLEQQTKVAKKFSDKQIDFLYLIHDDSCGVTDYTTKQLSAHVTRIDCNFCHATVKEYPESWNGNTALYYPILENYCFTPTTVKYLLQSLKELTVRYNRLEKFFHPTLCLSTIKAFLANRCPVTFYTTSHGTNIKLFGCIKTRIWPKKWRK